MMYETEKVSASELLYLYAQSTQIASQTGMIGFATGTLKDDGAAIFFEWKDVNSNLRDSVFRKTFVDLITDMRADFLKDRNSMLHFLEESSQLKIDDNWWAFKSELISYVFLVRINPNAIEENFCCYAYTKEWFYDHIRRAEKGIRFITPEYKDLFVIPDGRMIRLLMPDGKSSEKICRYVDDYHVEIGNSVYHICEFAEMCRRSSIRVSPVTES